MAKKAAIVEALDAAAEKDSNRSLVGRVEEIYDDIAEKQRIGVSNATIIEALNKVGFNLTEQSFKAVMFRVRKKRGLAKSIAKRGESNKAKPATTEKKSTQAEASGQGEATKPLDVRQRREQHADKYSSTNPLLKKT